RREGRKDRPPHRREALRQVPGSASWMGSSRPPSSASTRGTHEDGRRGFESRSTAYFSRDRHRPRCFVFESRSAPSSNTARKTSTKSIWWPQRDPSPCFRHACAFAVDGPADRTKSTRSACVSRSAPPSVSSTVSLKESPIAETYM